jgi:hypothetical protein
MNVISSPSRGFMGRIVNDALGRALTTIAAFAMSVPWLPSVTLTATVWTPAVENEVVAVVPLAIGANAPVAA